MSKIPEIPLKIWKTKENKYTQKREKLAKPEINQLY